MAPGALMRCSALQSAVALSDPSTVPQGAVALCVFQSAEALSDTESMNK
jgi:ABC-type molybdate transport system substrate-binding protein